LSIVDIFRNLKLDRIPLTKVSEIMTIDVKTCSPKDNIAKVWLNMKESGLSGYPVIKMDNLSG